MRYAKYAHKGQAVIESLFTIALFFMLTCSVAGLFSYLYIQFNLVTAARESARSAAVNPNLASTNTASAISTAQTAAINFFKAATGQTLTASQISINGPTGATVGQRIVSSTVSFTFKSPVNLPILGGPDLSSFPMSASASMRYEE